MQNFLEEERLQIDVRWLLIIDIGSAEDEGEMSEIVVVIPAYNSARCLPEAIDSVLNQTYKDLELIIVDDGSTDNTQMALKKYKDKIGYIYQENQGSYKARNTGIKATHSEYIAFLDADDIWIPQKLETQMEFIDANPNLGLVFSDADLFEHGISKGSFWKLRGCYDEMMQEYRMIQNPFSKLMEKNFILPSTALVKRVCFERAGLFDDSFRNVGDKEMWLRIAMHFPMGCVPYALVKRRVHGYTPEQDARIKRSVIDVIKKMEKRYPEYIEKEGVSTKRILGPLYYSLGRTYLDVDEIIRARESFVNSLLNSFSLSSLFFLMVSLSGLRSILLLRHLNKVLLKAEAPNQLKRLPH